MRKEGIGTLQELGEGRRSKERDGWGKWKGSKGEYERGHWLKEGKCEARETGGMRRAE